jgi:hypothetical protein
MDKEKSLFESLTDTVKAAAESIAHPTEGTPMQMPLNESGYAITHLQAVSKPAAKPPAEKKKTFKKPAKRAASQKSKSTAGKKGKKAVGKKKAIGKAKKKAVKKVTKKMKPKKSKR